LIIDRYLIREICKPLAAVCLLLVVIFASYKAAEYLAQAVAGVISAKIVIYLVLLKIAITLEVLIPITLFLSVVVALGRMYADSEITALYACGVGTGQVIKAVLYLAVPLAVLVGCLSLYVRPWAYQKNYWLKEQAKTALDITKWKEDNFYELQGVNRVLYADEIDHEQRRAEKIFIQSDRDNRVQVIYAKELYQRTDEKSGKKLLVFVDGYLYEFSRIGDEGHIMKFQQSTLTIEPENMQAPEFKRKATSTSELARSSKLDDIAEFQWRFSTPISTVLLALLGVPLSRTAPRKGRYAKLFAAVLIMAVYYNTSAMAKNWVEQGVIGPIPGIWWVVVLLALFVLLILIQPRLTFHWRQRWSRLSG
jgi:lipopolysaccharide export system permease protein